METNKKYYRFEFIVNGKVIDRVTYESRGELVRCIDNLEPFEDEYKSVEECNSDTKSVKEQIIELIRQYNLDSEKNFEIGDVKKNPYALGSAYSLQRVTNDLRSLITKDTIQNKVAPPKIELDSQNSNFQREDDCPKEELLNKFIEVERKKFRIGSGDDVFFEQQVLDYINKQKPLWLNFIKFILENKSKKLNVAQVIYKGCGKRLDYPDINCGEVFAGNIELCPKCQEESKSVPKGGLKIKACAILNEDNPEFFAELMSKGVDAVEPEMMKQLGKKGCGKSNIIDYKGDGYDCGSCCDGKIILCDECQEPEQDALTKKYQCGHCGKVYNKNQDCCGDLELEESYQCDKCKMLFSENWKHKCNYQEKGVKDGNN